MPSSAPMSQFSIKDLQFEIRSAKLQAYFSGQSHDWREDDIIAWNVKIKASTDAKVATDWEPRFISQTTLIETQRGEIASWRELSGRTGSWGDTGRDDPMGMLST